MLSVDEILFSNNSSEPSKSLSVLFESNINFDEDVGPVDVHYFFLNKNKTVGENNISISDKLIGVGLCEKTNMINACHFDGCYQIYFWVKPDEIGESETVREYWKVDDARVYVKAIKEKWIIERSTKKD